MSNLMKDRKVTVNFVYWISNISKGASLLERGRTGLNTDMWTVTINASALFAVAPPSCVNLLQQLILMLNVT